MEQKSSSMKGINPYHKELSKEEIEQNLHRGAVGGLWDELGKLQVEFLEQQGMRPSHTVLDIGCGSLRGGVRFMQLLDNGNYYGIDINQSLLDAGKIEAEKAGLGQKQAYLLVDDSFNASAFGVKFDFMVSISLFTHLPMNHILWCLQQAKLAMHENTRYFATFFEAANTDEFFALIDHQPGGISTRHHCDPFHYTVDMFRWMANIVGLNVQYIGDWQHPRNQKMLCFSP